MTDDENATPAGATPFTVLVVCTANQCRSPMAELLLRDALRRAGVGWTVVSAGTRAVPGRPMHDRVATLLRERGFEVSAWRSRAVDVALIDRADLILTADGGHRSQVVTLRPAALSRTFTLRQFAALAASVPTVTDPGAADAGARLLAAVSAARGHIQPLPQGAADIADPIGHRPRAFRACAATVSAAVDAIVSPLHAGASVTTSEGSTSATG